MNFRNSASLVAVAAGLALIAGSASAQSYSKIVIFGDSLSDNGNLGVNAPPPPYYMGHFSNGPVFVEQLGFGTINHFGNVSGSTDFAFGGARTDTHLNPVNPAATTPGIPIQVNAYLAGFGGSLNASTLVTLWGGANDIFQETQYLALNPPPSAVVALADEQATGLAAAQNIGTQAAILAANGAGTILVPNLPSLSATPAFNTNAVAGTLVDAATNEFNGALLPTLKAVAAANPHTNIILMDVNAASALFRSNPAAFGFTNVTQSCFNAAVPSICATPASYLYWDGVHPTTAGHHAIAELATEYLYYGNMGVPTAAEGETAVRDRSDNMDAALVRLPTHLEAGAPNVQVMIEGGEASVSARNGGLMPSTSDKGGAARIILNVPVSDTFAWGGQFDANRDQVRAGAINFHNMSYGGDVFGSWRSNNLFINAVGGVSSDNFQDIRRVTAVAPLVNHANAQGYSAGVKLQGGVSFPIGEGSISPRVAVSYVHEQVGAYTESGMLVTEHYAARGISSTSAEATVRFEQSLGDRMHGFIEAGYRDNAGYDADSVVVSLPGNTALPLSTSVGKPERGTGLVDAGLRAPLTDHMSVGVSYRGRFGSGFHDNIGALSLRWTF